MYDTIHLRTRSMLQVLVPLLCEAAPGINITVTLRNNGMYAVRAPRFAFKSKAVKEVIGAGVNG